MRRRVSSVAVAIGLAALFRGQPAVGDGLPELVLASNDLIGRANALRRQAAAGEIPAAEARAGVVALLADFDGIDRRAVLICRETVDEEALGEAADLLVHGPILQCLYALTEVDRRFGQGLGYAVVYERLLQLAVDDFCTENSVNQPQVLMAHFSDLVPRAIGPPWLDAAALEALRGIEPAREALGGEQTIQEHLSSLAGFASRSNDLLAEYQRTQNPGMLAGYLQTRLELVQAYAILLGGVTGDRAWTKVGLKFGDLAAAVVSGPEAMLAVFSDPEGPTEEEEDERPFAPLVKWFQIFRDLFNNPKPYVWRPDRAERNVEIGIEEGRLYIRGRSNPGWSRSGRVTWRWSGRSFVFTIDMGGAGTGYYWNMRAEGDNGSLVDLAFGGEWADSVFEIPRGDDPALRYGRPVGDLPKQRRHQGRIEYREDKKHVWGYIDDVLIGHGSVDLGQKKSFAIYVSSGDEVEYDAWFDNFDVRAP